MAMLIPALRSSATLGGALMPVGRDKDGLPLRRERE